MRKLGDLALRKCVMAGLIVAVVAAGAAVAGPLEDGEAAAAVGDYAKALRIWKPLADQGNADAQNHLGFMYESGKGVTPDYARAVNWYRKAADQGYVKAQGSLAFMYEIGHGVPQDYILAHMWLNLAASQGDDFAAEKRDAVAKLMTLEQVAEAQRLAREWKPTAAP
jgi:uncharacterized protein